MLAYRTLDKVKAKKKKRRKTFPLRLVSAIPDFSPLVWKSIFQFICVFNIDRTEQQPM